MNRGAWRVIVHGVKLGSLVSPALQADALPSEPPESFLCANGIKSFLYLVIMFVSVVV